MEQNRKPFHEMTLQEYLTTKNATLVSRWSILALSRADYTAERLGAFAGEQLKVLATLWGVSKSGSKCQMVERILRRQEFRETLRSHSLESFLTMSRRELVKMAREAGFFYSALTKQEIADQLIAWRIAEAERAARSIGEARHFRLVRKALVLGLQVPAFNLERYGLTPDGLPEACILGVPRSVVMRRAPEATAAARELSEPEFIEWVREHPQEAQRTNMIQAGAMYDGGLLFWRQVRSAFQPEPQATLFG